MKKYILLTEKKWHIPLFNELQREHTDCEWFLISDKESFKLAILDDIQPNFIFIPHWSYIVKNNIYRRYKCIVFHMTDLPYGRGGSPLQNLIVRGHQDTMISALLVEEGLDTGDIYLKKSLSLAGTAQDIFLRSVGVIKQMITEIIDEDLEPKSQSGEVTNFTRRKPKDGDISDLQDIHKVYDYIRMLDADDYPPAFIDTKYWRFEFSSAHIKNKNEIIADVRIIKK